LRKSLKSTHLIVRLNAVSEEKSTVSLGKQLQMYRYIGVYCSLFLPRTELRCGDRAFSVSSLGAWNRLPRELQLMRQSTTTLQYHLKTFLFNSNIQYFCFASPANKSFDRSTKTFVLE